MKDAEEALWHELELLKNEIIPEEELEKVRNRFESEFCFRNVGGENLCNNIALAELRGNLASHFDEPKKYRSVSAGEIKDCARELFRKGNSSVLYYLKK